MTKRFKKARNFDSLRFHREMQRDMIEEEEGDIFSLTDLERDKPRDELSDIEGYLPLDLEA